MDYMEQGRRAVKQHIDGFEQGQTCIDCHKGIAHSLPDMKSRSLFFVGGLESSKRMGTGS